jgi:serine kinase of HPr protein (carbohydrate metabolism regulator)
MSETVHATAVLVGAAGVLIRGEPGAGKSALALALIERGGRLIADDRLTLTVCHERVIASAPQATLGLIELRGRGVIKVPHERAGVIRLIADIVDEEGLERMPDEHQLSAAIAGIVLPRQPIPAATEPAVRLVQAALDASKSQPVKGLRMANV